MTGPVRLRAPCTIAGAALLVALAILLGGCVKITNVELNGNADAGSNHLITMEAAATMSSDGPVRGVIAIRIPSAWDVRSVTLTGPAVTGTVERSTTMENVYASDWEATVGVGHNGHKSGYKWWVGYSSAEVWAVGDRTGVVIAVDTHGRGGTYQLDFATGIADKDDPEDAAGDKGLWQIGSAGVAPTGILLDRGITLNCFTDVQPEGPFYEAIQGLGAKGIIQGYGPMPGGYHEFRGINPVNRAQYVKFICGALNAAGVPGYTITEGMAAPVNFPDLGADNPTDLYPHEYVWTAWSHGIVKGYSNGNFQPYVPVERGHVISMTVRALQALGGSLLAMPPAGFVQTWGKDMLAEHKANARIAEYNHLLDGIPVASGVASMPRQEAAQVMWNMMNLLAKR